VASLQRSLTALGYPASVDGIFGPETLAAAQKFQADHGLDADGIIGKRTSEAIEAALASSGLFRRFWLWLKNWFAG
jgi:peptidoglycan hydrolase-like protein with peptidoglycan-binding domain